MEKPWVTKLWHPNIQLPVDPLLAAITWSNHFLIDFISFSHWSVGLCPTLVYNVAPVYWGLWVFVYAQLSPHGFSQDELWTLTGLLQPLDSFIFSRSVVDLLGCLGSLSRCMTQFWPNFSCRMDVLVFDCRILWYTEEFMVDSMTVRCSGPVVY